MRIAFAVACGNLSTGNLQFIRNVRRTGGGFDGFPRTCTSVVPSARFGGLLSTGRTKPGLISYAVCGLNGRSPKSASVTSRLHF